MTRRATPPTREKIAEYHGASAEYCWACERFTTTLERAHIVAHALGGSGTDPANFVLLCPRCHADAPNVTDPAAMWEWIDCRDSEISEVWKALAAVVSEYPELHNEEGTARTVEALDTLRESYVVVGGRNNTSTRAWLARQALETARDGAA